MLGRLGVTADARDWADADYVRVYQSIRDDPKLASVYADDRLLSAWLRLLMDADLTFPRPASLPVWLSRYARERLTTLGVLVISGHSYTLSGLSKERRSRAMTAAERQAAWRARRNGHVTPVVVSDVTNRNVDPVTPRVGARTSASVSDSVSASLAGAREADPEPVMAAVAYVEERTRRPFGFGLGSKVWDTLSADVRDFGWPAVQAQMEAEKVPFPDVAQLVFGASRRLHPITSPAADDSATDQAWIKQQLAERKKTKRA